MVTQLEPYIQLGFAGGFAVSLLWLVRVYMTGLIKQNAEMVDRITASNDKMSVTLENHLSSVARSLTLVEERLGRADVRSEAIIPALLNMKSDTDLIKSALVQSTIVPPGTKATVEPASVANTSEALDEIRAQKEERARVRERDRRIDEAARAAAPLAVEVVNQPLDVKSV